MHEILKYDLEALGVGWYLNWGAALDPPHPNGVAFQQTIRINQGVPRHTLTTIANMVRANPGSTWLIGNEPDSVWNDSSTPSEYAEAYREIYHVIKDADPTALVGFGGLVQATPLRMLYLDHIWQHYMNTYGEQMPVDVWAVHGFILREGMYGWGAGIPPGMQSYAYLGMDYQIRDTDRMDIFVEHIERFRQWMADHGQREKPLLVNEYGILMWPDIIDEDGNDFDDGRVSGFMTATFDYFRTATDPDLGHPADGNRLVQAWAWYSLDDNAYVDGQIVGEGYNGDLFTGEVTTTITALGQAYADYVQGQVGIGPAYTDLWPISLQAEFGDLVWGEVKTITLTTEVVNHGRQPASSVEVQFWDGEPGAGGTPIGALQTIPSVPSRYEGGGLAAVSWTTVVSGQHTIWVDVDPADSVSESDESNNQRSIAITLTTDLMAAPVLISPVAPLWSGSPVTVTARAVASNAGEIGVPSGARVLLRVDDLISEPIIDTTLGPLIAGAQAEITVQLSFTQTGLHWVFSQVDANDILVETDEGNNLGVGFLVVATDRVYLATVFRSYP